MKLGRKTTSGKYHKRRKKRLSEKTSQENTVILGETKRKKVRIRGGNTKIILLRSNEVGILTKNKNTKAEIKNVLETPQNRFLARQNRLIKGAIIETTVGKAKITNRPAKEGHINALLIEE